MQINDEMKRELNFKEAQDGEVFKYYIDGVANRPIYCIKTEPYYEDGEVAFNAVDLETGVLVYIEPHEKIIITSAELTVK